MPLYNIVDVVGAILVELNMVTWTFLEDDDCDFDRAEDAQLVGFLEETILTL